MEFTDEGLRFELKELEVILLSYFNVFVLFAYSVLIKLVLHSAPPLGTCSRTYYWEGRKTIEKRVG